MAYNLRHMAETLKASSPVLKTLLNPPKRRRPPVVVHNPKLAEIRPHALPWSSVANMSTRLGVQPAVLLEIIGVSERTALRRKEEGYLKPDEADRLLRVARIYEEALQAFGDEEMAVGWLSDKLPLFYGESPLSFLSSDAGTQRVSRELMRIRMGEFIG